MLDIEYIKEAVESPSFRMPSGLEREQKRFLIKLASTNEKLYRELELFNDDLMKESVIELMFEKKVWNPEILEVGGISYYELKNPEGRTTADGKLFKNKYRVAMTRNGKGKLLKFRIKTASGEIFSVASKTCGEAQYLVDSIFGKSMYRVSQMLN